MKPVFLFMILAILSFRATAQIELLIQEGVQPYDNFILVSGDEQKLLIEKKLWDLAANQQVLQLEEWDPNQPIENRGRFLENNQAVLIQGNKHFVYWNLENAIPQFALETEALAINKAGSIYAAIDPSRSFKKSKYQQEDVPEDISERFKRFDNSVLIGHTSDGQTIKIVPIPDESLERLSKTGFAKADHTIWAAAEDGTFYFLNWNSGEIVSQVNIDPKRSQVGRLWNQAIDPNENYAVAVKSKKELLIYDLVESKLKYNIKVSVQSNDIIGFTPNGKFLYVFTKVYSKTNLKIIDLQKGKIIHSFDALTNFECSADGKWMYVCTGKGIFPNYKQTGKIYDLNAFKEKYTLEGAKALAFFPDNSNRIAYLSNNGVTIQNLEAGSNPPPSSLPQAEEPSTASTRIEYSSRHITNFAYVPDQQKLLVGSNNTLAIDLNNLAYETISNSGNFQISSNTDYFCFSEPAKENTFRIKIINRKEGSNTYINEKGKLIRYNISLDNQSVVALFIESLQNPNPQYLGIYSLKTGKQQCDPIPLISPTYGYNLNQHILSLEVSDSIELIDIRNKKTVKTFKGYKSINYSDDGQLYALQNIDEIQVYQSDSDSLVTRFPFKISPGAFSKVKFSPDKQQLGIFYQGTFYLVQLSSGNIIREFETGGNIYTTHFDAGWKYFLSYNALGGGSVFDLNTGKKVFDLYLTGDDHFFLLTPDHYYMASKKGAINGIAFKEDEQVFSFDQYDLKYNRPDLVLREIGFASDALIEKYQKAYVKRLEKMGLNEASFNKNTNIPSVQFRNDLPTTTTDATLTFSMLANGQNELLDRINIYVNGVPIHGRQGHSLQSKQTEVFQEEFEIALNNGINKIELEAINQAGNFSKRVSHSIKLEKEAAKANLYLVGIGVEKFKDERFNLAYPLKDIRDFANTLKEKGQQYDQIIVDTLFDESVTPENLLRIKSKLSRTKVDDKVILFVAGHGILTENLDYCFATPSIDFSTPKNRGIAFEQLENLIDGIPARYKLFLMDACHSGEIDKGSKALLKKEYTETSDVRFRSFDTSVTLSNTDLNNSFELMNTLFVDLRTGTGATIISSASGVEFAFEGDNWRNSVFTYALLNGLKNRMADSNDDGKIMITELQEYLTTKVAELTNNQQRPTFRSQNIVNDWRIW